MFTISVEMTFKASHQLTLSDGSIEPVHSHDWSVAAEVAGEKLNDTGFVIDFNDLRAELRGIITPLENTQLGNLDCFENENPSAENVAKYVYEKLSPKLPKSVHLQSIAVGEEHRCRAKFTG
ncbi:MAG: 6-carboxytetrahydropterin synthase [Sedimentisphaerales bacterium]|nr:6-carboxytetrahydropterin synthase [Sedimentisphaerales bacterium]